MRNVQHQRAVGQTPLFSLFKPMRLLILVAVVYFTKTHDGHLEMIISPYPLAHFLLFSKGCKDLNGSILWKLDSLLIFGSVC